MALAPTSRRRWLAACMLMSASALPAWAADAAWPSKPIRILVGFPGGSTPDIAARALAKIGRASCRERVYSSV